MGWRPVNVAGVDTNIFECAPGAPCFNWEVVANFPAKNYAYNLFFLTYLKRHNYLFTLFISGLVKNFEATTWYFLFLFLENVKHSLVFNF